MTTITIPDGRLVSINQRAFITPAMLADESKGWHAITDPKRVRALRKYYKKMERQIRNTQRLGGVVRRIRHRHAPHGRRRILAWRGVW